MSPDTPLQSSNAAAIASALWDSADLAGAATHYERALRENPVDLEALHGLGRLRLAQNDLAGAALLLEQGLGLAMQLPHHVQAEWTRRVRHELAWSYYRLDRFDLAAEYLAHLPGLEPLAAQVGSFGERPPYRIPAEVEEVALPFLGTDPLPIVTVVIGGQEHAFVLDTGSSQMVVDTALLRQQGLPSFGTREATFASGQRAPIGYTLLPEVQLGEMVVRDVPAEVMDVRRLAPQLSGFIGTNFLQHFHVLCEWEEQLFRLRPLRQPPFDEWEQMETVPFLFLDSHLLLVPARLNEHPTYAYVTSGMAGAPFAVPPSSVVQAGLQAVQAGMEGIGAGGSAALELVRARSVCAGEWCRANQTGLAGFFPAELEWRYGFRVGALLGQSFIRQRRWGIDFSGARFLFS